MASSSERRRGGHLGAGLAQRGEVFPVSPLQNEYTDSGPLTGQRAGYNRARSGSALPPTAATIRPSRVKICPGFSARPPPAHGEDWS